MLGFGTQSRFFAGTGPSFSLFGKSAFAPIAWGSATIAIGVIAASTIARRTDPTPVLLGTAAYHTSMAVHYGLAGNIHRAFVMQCVFLCISVIGLAAVACAGRGKIKTKAT